MRVKSLGITVGVGIWTAATLAGSIFAAVSLPLEGMGEQSNLHLSLVTQGLLLLLILVVIFAMVAVGGGLWAWGVALMLGADRKRLLRTGAFAWGGSVMAAGIVLYFSQLPLAIIDRSFIHTRYDTHYLFTLVFVPAVGFATMATTRRMADTMGYGEIKRAVGRNSGGAAAVAFFAASLVLLYGYGWEVAGPFAGRRYSMILIMHVCNAGAALAGGCAMAWTLTRGRVAEPVFDMPE